MKKIQFNPNLLYQLHPKNISLSRPPSCKLIHTKKNKNARGGIPSDQRSRRTSLAALVQMQTKQLLSERAPYALRKSRPSVLRSQSIARPDSLSQRKRWTTSVYLFPLPLSFLLFGTPPCRYCKKGFVPHRDWHQQSLSNTERLRPSGRHRPLCPSRTDGLSMRAPKALGMSRVLRYAMSFSDQAGVVKKVSSRERERGV